MRSFRGANGQGDRLLLLAAQNTASKPEKKGPGTAHLTASWGHHILLSLVPSNTHLGVFVEGTLFELVKRKTIGEATLSANFDTCPGYRLALTSGQFQLPSKQCLVPKQLPHAQLCFGQTFVPNLKLAKWRKCVTTCLTSTIHGHSQQLKVNLVNFLSNCTC